MIKKPNFILIAVICLFVIVEILFLRPTTVETVEEEPQGMFNSIESMVQAKKEKDEEIGYTIEGFHYTAVEGEKKDWEMNAKQALLYEKSRILHAQNVLIRMFDASGKVTNIEGNKADYRMDTKDLDLEGDVKVTFPDQFWVTTTKARYTSKQELISTEEPFYGEAVPQKDEMMHMWGRGFVTTKKGPDIHILNEARVQMKRLDSDEITNVKSDLARVDRAAKVAYFSMSKPEGFVESDQGTMHVKGRRQDATYDPTANVLKYLTAYDDVLIREMDVKKSKTGLKYATCQKADFLTQQDKILLSGFPSAYQENDTVTGDLIIVYRKKNLVEVTQANAYHEATEHRESAEPGSRKRKKH